MKPSDIRVRDVQVFTFPVVCRSPLTFGSAEVESLWVGYAKATVVNREGKMAVGWGAMSLLAPWAWPSGKSSPESRQEALCDLLAAYARCVRSYRDFAHPMEIFLETREALAHLAGEVSGRLTPGEAMPPLAALVAASPVDHALHDAFGLASRIDSYRGYGPECMAWDLSRYLGREFRGVYPSQFLRTHYAHRVAVVHLVGGADVLRDDRVEGDRPDDGVPNSLEKWIERDGVFCLKVTLCGNDVEWDMERTIEVSRVYREVQRRVRPDLPARPCLSADANEQCESPQYVVMYLRQLKERDPEVFRELRHVEQPTGRDLEADRFDLGPVSRLKPVLLDEGLSGIEAFRLATELGWSGAALKSCKSLSLNLLLVPMAELAGIPYAVQDLTSPSLALVESVGLAARTHSILGVEANARQYVPAASHPEAAVHPGLYEIRDGYAYTDSLSGPGLGYQIERIGRDLYRR